ncbi:MAG: preprotein translocase subunit SecB [Pseudomonadota bacterium]|nr:preprotein translocase subunit SecB [Pseudomonadota bacterium]
MSEQLQRAIESLEIHDVYLRSSESRLSEGFEPKYAPELETLDVQLKHVVTHSNTLLLEEDEGEPTKLFRVFIELGTRWVDARGDESSDDDDARVKAKIEGIMVAEYRVEGDPGKEALKEFALRNASYHVWPYWREYLTTQCMRMNLPKIVLPTTQIAQNQRRSE